MSAEQSEQYKTKKREMFLKEKRLENESRIEERKRIKRVRGLENYKPIVSIEPLSPHAQIINRIDGWYKTDSIVTLELSAVIGGGTKDGMVEAKPASLSQLNKKELAQLIAFLRRDDLKLCTFTLKARGRAPESFDEKVTVKRFARKRKWLPLRFDTKLPGSLSRAHGFRSPYSVRLPQHDKAFGDRELAVIAAFVNIHSLAVLSHRDWDNGWSMPFRNAVDPVAEAEEMIRNLYELDRLREEINSLDCRIEDNQWVNDEGLEDACHRYDSGLMKIIDRVQSFRELHDKLTTVGNRSRMLDQKSARQALNRGAKAVAPVMNFYPVEDITGNDLESISNQIDGSMDKFELDITEKDG